MTSIFKFLPPFLFVLGTFVTFDVYNKSSLRVTEDRNNQLQRTVQVAANGIENRLRAYAEYLVSTRALFLSSEKVTQKEWNSFLRALELRRNYPEVINFGFLSKDKNSLNVHYSYPPGSLEPKLPLNYLGEEWLGRIPPRNNYTVVYAHIEATENKSKTKELLFFTRANSAGDEVFFAQVSMNFLISSLFLNELKGLDKETRVQILENSQEVYSNFKEVHDPDLVTTQKINVLGQPWRVNLQIVQTPTPSSIPQPGRVFFVGIAISVLLSLLAYFLVKILNRSKNVLSEVTSRLQNTNEVLEEALEGIAQLDDSGKFLAINKTFAKLVDSNSESLLHLNWRDIIHQNDIPQAEEKQKEMLSVGKSELEVKVIRFSKTEFYGHLVFVKSQKGFYCFLRNISDRKQIELWLQNATNKAIEASNLKSQFMAKMSHEIRTPLNGIMGMAQLLKDPLIYTREEQSEFVDAIRYSSETLLRLINDILDFSKMEAGKLRLTSSPIQLATILDHVQKNFIFFAARKQLEFHVDDCSQIAPIEADATRLKQILFNLVSNSIKFTEKGFVKVTVKVVSEDKANILIRFEVSDSGIGIPADKHGQIFQPFEQFIALPNEAGTGLGLSISQQISELMGGRITFKSVPGNTSFMVEIPFKKITKFAPTSSSTNDIPEISHSAHVLIVEDNEINQKVAEKMLSKLGLCVTVAANGVEALAILEKNKFDIIFMDCQMPEMDGYTATRELRKKNVDTPIVAMTAYAYDEDQKNCMDAGMNDFLTKPISSQELADTVQKWLTKNDPSS